MKHWAAGDEWCTRPGSYEMKLSHLGTMGRKAEKCWVLLKKRREREREREKEKEKRSGSFFRAGCEL
jgi:hypothetical protein